MKPVSQDEEQPVKDPVEEPVEETSSLVSPSPLDGGKSPVAAEEMDREDSIKLDETRLSRAASTHLSDKGFHDWEYVELFKLGEGYAWMYGLWVLLIEISRGLKYVGLPGAGQIVALLKEIMETPFIGDILMAIMGKASRNSYKMAGATADMHPPIADFWDAPKGDGFCGTLCDFCVKCCSCQCCGCRCCQTEDVEAPTEPSPLMFGERRGTPEFTPFCNFSKTIMANERTDRKTSNGEPDEKCGLIEQIFFFASRGFRLRFKTEKGGADCFNIHRQGPSNLWIAFGLFLKLYAYICGKKESKMANDEKPCLRGPQTGCDILGDDDSTLIGSIEETENSFCGPHGFCRNRFNKQPKPIYDVLDAEGEIRFQIMIPVYKDSWLMCFEAWWDEEYLAIVRPEEAEALNKEDEWAMPKTTGWVVQMRPKFYDTIQQAMKDMKACKKCIGRLTCGMISGLLDFTMKIILAFVACLRTLPIDDCTQVPNPGTKDLRAASPCSHTISAMRARMPDNCTETERLLLKGALVWLSHDDTLMYT